MLKAQYTPSTEILEVIFDEPLPASCAGHAGFTGFMDLIDSIRDRRILRQDERIVGFTVPYNDFIDTFAGLLPQGQLVLQKKLRQCLLDMPSVQSEGLQVNFHQKSFDSPERSWNFILNQGFFCQHVFNRIAWYMAPRHAVVTDYPLHVDVETANTCNMNCPMCYRDQMLDVGQMEYGLFTYIVDQCAAAGLYSMRLSWRGEPLSHPRVKEMIAYAAGHIPNVSFLTNAFYLDETLNELLIQSKVAYIAVSFDGIGEVYNAVRRPAKFDDSRARVAALREDREAAGVGRPQIRLSTIWPAVSMAPDAYREAMTPVSDYMAYNPYINFKGELRLKENFICQFPWERIVVSFAGKAQCCTGWNAGEIILGDVSQTSIRDMWHSPQMQLIRTAHREGQRMSLNSCADCRHGSEGDRKADIWTIVERKY
jgi:MoaA/NifB/PqqE/SkfB family radical SAM enzyme